MIFHIVLASRVRTTVDNIHIAKHFLYMTEGGGEGRGWKWKMKLKKIEIKMK